MLNILVLLKNSSESSKTQQVFFRWSSTKIKQNSKNNFYFLFQVLSSTRLSKNENCLAALHPMRTSGGRWDLSGMPSVIGNCNPTCFAVVPGRAGPAVPRTSLWRPQTARKARLQGPRNGLYLFSLEIVHYKYTKVLFFRVGIFFSVFSFFL